MTDRLFDWDKGLVSRRIFIDPDIYEREKESVFRRCWLFVGHATSVVGPGAYITNYMGEDAVIVWRDASDRIHAFLNTCTHRGNKLCLFDRGRSLTVACSYHGWSFNPEGRLVGVPFVERAYYGELDREKYALTEARVALHGDLIFATWDPDPPSLEVYLGEMAWYIDTFVDRREGGIEILATHKWVMPCNWKFPSENFGGDAYHVQWNHLSAVKVGFSRGATASQHNAGRMASPGNGRPSRHCRRCLIRIFHELVGDFMRRGDRKLSHFAGRVVR